MMCCQKSAQDRWWILGVHGDCHTVMEDNQSNFKGPFIQNVVGFKNMANGTFAWPFCTWTTGVHIVTRSKSRCDDIKSHAGPDVTAAVTTIVVSIREISQWHESWFVVTLCHQRCLLSDLLKEKWCHNQGSPPEACSVWKCLPLNADCTNVSPSLHTKLCWSLFHPQHLWRCSMGNRRSVPSKTSTSMCYGTGRSLCSCSQQTLCCASPTCPVLSPSSSLRSWCAPSVTWSAVFWCTAPPRGILRATAS